MAMKHRAFAHGSIPSLGMTSNAGAQSRLEGPDSQLSSHSAQFRLRDEAKHRPDRAADALADEAGSSSAMKIPLGRRRVHRRFKEGAGRLDGDSLGHLSHQVFEGP